MDLLCIKIKKEMKEVNSKEFSVVKIIQEPVDSHNFLPICARKYIYIFNTFKIMQILDFSPKRLPYIKLCKFL